MSSAPTQLAVAPGASSLVTTTTQIKKDYLEEPSYSCQNSLPPRIRSVKGKHLTRSHAMHESASPPRTPTPRSSAEGLASSPVSFSGSASATTHSHSSSCETVNDHKVQVQSLSSSPLLASSPVSITSSIQTQEQFTSSSSGAGYTTNQQQSQQTISTSTTIMYSGSESNGVVCNQSQLDVDFPKLTPPKSSKGHRNHNNNNVNRDSSEKQLNNSSDSSSSSISTKQSGNYSSGGNSDGKSSNNKGTEMDGVKMNHHHNNNSKNNRGNNNSSNSLNNGQSPPMQKQTQSQRRNQASYSQQQQQQMQDQQQQQHQNHQIQSDSNLINSLNNMQISCPSPPQSHQLCHDKETSTTNNRYIRANDDNCGAHMGGNQMNCNNSSCSSSYGHDENRNNVISESPTDNTTNMSTGNAKCDRQMGKKHRNNANAKGTKARLKNMGSSSSVEGGNSTSGFISRDSSTEQFTDSSGIDLKEFFRETLSKNPIDRYTLLEIEKDLTDLVHDKTRTDIQYPAMSSYNRMLIHRVAAFFGMEHNVDSATPQCVIVSKTKQTRIPSIKFKSLYRASDAPPRKSILKRDAYSFDEPRRNLLNCPDRGMLDRKAKSYEQREEEYEQVRHRIFHAPDGGGEMNEWPPSQWCGNESPDHSKRLRHNKLLKVQSMSTETRQDGRPSVSKSHSFGGYGGPQQSGGPLTRGDSINSTRSAGPRLFPKQDSIGSTNTPWRLSPSSSGYKTQTQSLRSDSVTPSPTGYGSDDHTPEPCVVQSPPAIPFGVVWAVTDMASVPRGSVLINPHTLQPIVNQDGSIYRFDPSNLPPSQAATPGTYSNCNNKSSGIPSSHRKIIVDKPKVIQTDLLNGVGNNDHNTTHTNNLVNSSSINNTQDSVENNSGQSPPIVNNTNSVENLSESSAQTVLVVDTSSANQDSEHETNITKDNHPHREMSDIQEESVESFTETGSQSNEDKSLLTMDTLTDTHDKPKLINQATSPNIPSPEPDHEVQLNENTKSNSNSTVDTNPSHNSVNTTSSSASSSSSTTSVQQSTSKKDDTTNKQSSATPNIPLMSFAPTGYQAFDGSTVFASPSNGPFPAGTAYQTGIDGSVYAVPQPMVYAYPPPMDGEFQGYFMPVYDQTQRDPNGLMAAASTQTIYQPAGGPATAVVAYPTAAPYGGAPLYQGQVVYSPADQFATAATGGQLQQYPVPTYPVGYTYPYNGYWGQPTMTYYVPQPAPPPIASSIISQSMAGSTAGGVTTIGSSAGHSSNSNSSSGSASTKRSTPPQNSSSGHNSQSVTPAAASTYQFAAPPGLPLTALATASADPNAPPGTTMYAIPQTATVFPSMLPYAPPPGTPSGVLSHPLPAPGPHPQSNAVINSMISTQAASGMAGGPQIPLDVSGTPGGGVLGGVTYALNNVLADRNGSHGGNNSGGTPHSAPSTPLSNSVALTHQPRNQPPLFATPPMLPATYNNHLQNQYSHLADIQNGCGVSSYSSGSSNYERKNSSKRNGGYSQNSRQNSYTNSNQNGRKTNVNDLSNNSASSPATMQNGGGNRSSMHMQQKRINNSSDKIQSSVNNSNAAANSAQNNSNNSTDKSRNSSMISSVSGGANNGGGIRSKPSNLDLRRSASQRNSPSTNSIESNNNSPNSIASMGHITSNLEHAPPMYMTRGTHVPPMHPPMHPPTAAAVVAAAAAAAAAANDACHQQLIGAAYNPPAGMYIKYPPQPYFAPHPSMALPNSRRSPPNDMRPQLAPLTGVYPTVNMMLPAPRTMPPRQPNPNYKGNKPSR